MRDCVVIVVFLHCGIVTFIRVKYLSTSSTVDNCQVNHAKYRDFRDAVNPPDVLNVILL